MSLIPKVLKNFLNRERQKREIWSMPDMQVSDLAMTKSDLLAFANARSNAPEQMKQMASKFGLSPDAITRERWRELEIVQNCDQCSQHRRCRRYLATGSGFSRQQCPNSSHYIELKQLESD